MPHRAVDFRVLHRACRRSARSCLCSSPSALRAVLVIWSAGFIAKMQAAIVTTSVCGLDEVVGPSLAVGGPVLEQPQCFRGSP